MSFQILILSTFNILGCFWTKKNTCGANPDQSQKSISAEIKSQTFAVSPLQSSGKSHFILNPSLKTYFTIVQFFYGINKVSM